MTVSFRAYIDESGDEGFSFRQSLDKQASSDWFVLAAFVTRKSNDLETVKTIDRVRAEFKLHPRKHVHWKDLKHPEKIRYSQVISELRIQAIAICVHKPSLLEPEKFGNNYRLYFYCVRYLLERLSWLVRDHHSAVHGGDGTAEVIFSNRQGMPYEEMKEYLRLLKIQKENGQNVQIEFDRVPVEKISTQTPGRSMGLQLADAVAGAIFNGLERDRYGNSEPRYAQTLFAKFYRHKGSARGYGIKIVPPDAEEKLGNHGELKWLETLNKG